MKALYVRLTISIVACCLTAQFSQQYSTGEKEKPKINFSGRLIDQTGSTYSVNNITISGAYRSIPFYKKPRKVSTSPETNTTRIDLKEIAVIHVPYHNDSPSIHSFKNRDYLEVEITLHDATKNTYIIERSRKLFCDEITHAGPIEKEIAFEAVDTVKIDTYKEREPYRTKKNSAH